MHRVSTRLLVLGAVSTVLLGAVGILLAAEGALLVLPSPSRAKPQAWRLLVLTALTTGLIAALVGGVYFAVTNLASGNSTPSQSVFAFFEGGVILGVPGTLLGAAAGAVVAMDHWRRTRGTVTPSSA